MSISTEVAVSIVFGTTGAIVAVAAVVQAAIYFSRLHHSKLTIGQPRKDTW
jgi:hypothetical protein